MGGCREWSAATEDSDALVTVDRGIEHQQNASTLPPPVIVLLASRNRLAELQPLVPGVASLLSDPLETESAMYLTRPSSHRNGAWVNDQDWEEILGEVRGR